MSEYQYVAFRAIDKPLDDKALAYMRRQSSRAEVTPSSFRNEYHFGDFSGDAIKMLRRGYDLHLHYANFGVRKLCIRLPGGLPGGDVAQAYVGDEAIELVKDGTGPGATLVINPFYEPDDLEELWDLDEMFARLVPLRDELLRGDLRPLYIGRLAAISDTEHDPDETVEPPVPAGLAEPTPAQRALAAFYGIDQFRLAAAGQGTPPPPRESDASGQFTPWLRRQPEATKDAWLAALMDGSQPHLRAELLARFREEATGSGWPCVEQGRTVAQLRAAADALQREHKERAAAEKARKRAKKLADIVADPTPYLRETEQLVARRSTDAYRQAARLLVEVRDALADTEQADLAERQARKLKESNPTLNHLTAALRREGFIPK